MTVTTFRRPSRAAAPEAADHDPAPRPAPRLPVPDGSGGSLTAALPALSGLGSVAYLFAGSRSAVTYAAGAAMLLSSLAMGAGSLTRGRASARRSADRARAGYARHLRGLRRSTADTADARRRRERFVHPDPELLTSLGTRMWERRRDDPDFLTVRIGLGAMPPPGAATESDDESDESDEDADPWALAARARHLAAHGRVHDMPVTLTLRDLSALGVTGPDARSLVRALLVQVAALHSPTDVAIAVRTPLPDDPAWAWVKWLPHAQDAAAVDALGSARLLGPDVQGDDAARHVLLVVDGLDAPAPRPDLTVLAVDDGRDVPGSTVAHATGGRVTVRGPDLDLDARVDDVPVALAEAVARTLARYRPAEEAAAAGGPPADLPALLGLPDAATLDVRALRAGRTPVEHLRTAIGTAPDGSPVLLDIEEAARGGVGPHGLIVGATGSGKSELLRTLVVGMAATHESTALNLLLVDFKGGATFAGLSGLPHVGATITNLEDDLSLVDRMHAALTGELVRRQELLRDAGALTSVHDYGLLRREQPHLAPLPALWVVVDEFSELLAHKPELVDLFGQLGRLGRSLGVHLLLASQRIDEGRLRGLEAHLSYRIALRTFSEAESRAVLDVPDAYALPAAPGHGYLKTDGRGLQRFRAAFCADPVRAPRLPDAAVLRPFTAAPQSNESTAPAATTSVLDVLVDRLRGHGPPAHRVWLPPLDAPDPLDALLAAPSGRPGRGLSSDPHTPPLRVPVGTVDLPHRQCRAPHLLDLAEAHGAVVGGPRSGKSTVLRTAVAALALRHTPRELQIYVVDLGGALTSLAGLPHVGALAGRHEPDLVRRMVDQISALVALRESTGGTGDGYGDVLLVVDGWGALRQEWEDLEDELTTLAGRGLAHGVHLLVSANRWLDLRLGLRDLVTAKLELKLGDPLDSEVDRRAQQRVPAGRPGRGVTGAGDHWLAALPRIDGRATTEDLHAAVAGLVEDIAQAWAGPRAPAVRLLPDRVGLAELPTPDGHRLTLGVEGRALQPITVDTRAAPGLLLLGDAGSGRTSLLRSLATQVTGRDRPDDAKVVLIDHRRSLLGEFTGPSVLAYCTSPEQTEHTVTGLVAGFTRRLPTADTTATELRERSWWQGPDIVVLVDDLDLVSPPVGMSFADDPLLPLLALLPHARDIGLHLVLACRATGRTLAEPLVARLRELGAPTVVLSASAEEGLLCGVRPRALPPGRGTLVDRRGAVQVQLVRTD